MSIVLEQHLGADDREPERRARPARNHRAMTTPIYAAPRITALAVTLGLAAACWIVVFSRTGAMDMGVANRLDPFPVFLAGWAVMMAAMMLPGAAPAAARRAERSGRARSVPVFLAGYLSVWTAIGVAVYALDRPHSTGVAGALAIAAGAYELTPVKSYLRRRCQAECHSGVLFGLYCAGSGVGLTVLLVAMGLMSIGWMAVLACLGLAQKLLQPKPRTDIPVALAIVWLGALILLAPDSVPGLMPSI
jgi:predicted metal-binding membrane protein